jgi:hypothetical protein
MKPILVQPWQLSVLGYGQDGLDSILGRGRELFSPSHRVQIGSEAHPAPRLMGTGGIFPEIKRPGHEVDHLSPSRAEIKNT